MPSDRFKSIKSARVAKTFKIKCQKRQTEGERARERGQEGGR